jgi:capsid protein
MAMTALDREKKRNEIARLQMETAAMNHRSRILAKYDATESNRARRQAQAEYLEEGGIYDMTRRLKGCNLGRDLERNYSPARGIMHQFRVNVVGEYGKLRVNVPNGDEATGWFNEVWAKDCDYRDDCDWSTMLQNVLASVIREGDMLAVVDDEITGDDSGKLLTWEADQIAPLSDSAFRAAAYIGRSDKDKQDNGLIRNPWGKVLAYVTSGKRGMAVIDKVEDATIYARGLARLVKNPWRLNQGRGVPSLITPATNFIDLYEILASELLTAKRAAKQYAFVKREDAVTDWDSPATGAEFLPENDDKTAGTVAKEGANETTKTGAKNYERLETFTGGLTDYLAPKDTVEFAKIDRPNSQLAAFMDAVNGQAGAALGLAHAYTVMAAQGSYTAFRGDMIMSWVTFYWLQKVMERTVADWVAVRVLRWAQRKKAIAALPAGWERALSWQWPKMPEVNELDAQNAIAAALKNGTTDYSELLGPDWRKRLQDYSEMCDFIRSVNLPLKVLETASGGKADQEQEINRGSDDDTEDDPTKRRE